MLDAGTQAPDFSLTDAHGETVTLTDILKDGPAIVYFYPADFTPGCTKEACAIRDIHDDLLETGLRVFGISAQDGESHQRFAERYGLPFPLLCDPDKAVTKAYGLNGPLGIGSRRGTFLIDADGVIEDAVLADINISKHLKFIEKAMAAR
ncbi:MAG: peroxiredoxin [Pseudomonadota bacterium]